MKRLIIICEGQTELEFCKDVLQPFFLTKNILLQTPLVKKSGGGIVPWPILKRQIVKHLLEPNVFVTTFLDYYGIPAHFKFPRWEQSTFIQDKNKRMDFLEEGMKLSVDNYRFLPYLQLHEFEGLLFNNIQVFDENFAPEELYTREELLQIIQSHPNPEMINEGRETAPSKRLKRIIAGYNKVIYGAILAESIGLPKMRSKCPRFDNWLNILSNI